MAPADPGVDGAATSPSVGRLPRSPRGLPAGLVTFVMADIEGSTRLFHELGDGYPALLEQYRALLTRACRRNLGIVVETDGDSLLAAFADAGDALAACLEAQQGLAGPKWTGRVRVLARIGVHTGEATPMGNGYVALAVHQVARICAGAHGGQVLVSEAAVDAAGGRLPQNAELAVLGSFRLRGFPAPVQLAQLHHPDLRADFPPLRGLGNVAAVLPIPLTSFVGRVRELDVLGARIAAQRLVTVVGPGGSGKTRLALEAARRHEARGTPAVLVELAGTSAAALLPAQVATALGIQLSVGDPVSALADALRDRQLLLLLDNCEHLLDAAALLAATLLARCPDLTVLATSRQPLGVPGESVLPCEPLETDGDDSDAVRLFLDRARLAVPSVEPSPGDLALVRQLCAELDGLPLALELAAAALTTMPLTELVTRLGDRFAVLSQGVRGVPARQQTLAATIRWSVDRLPANELALFTAVSVFSGGFATDAVDAVAGPELGDGASTLAPLRALADKSLLQIDHGAGRYRMLETLRQYADTLLDDAARRRLRDRQLAFLAELAERIEPTLRGREGAVGWRRLDAERLNVRAAFAHALATDQGEAALRIAAAVSWWWYRRGQVAEGRRWLADALAAAPAARAAVRVRALLGDALLAYLAGDVVSIRARVEEVVTLAPEEAGDTVALAIVLRAFVRALLGETEAVADFEVEARRAVAAAERSGVAWVRAEIAMTRGQFARMAGDADAALRHLDEAEAIAVEIGHSWAVGSALFVRAKVLLALGRGPEAVRAAAMGVSAALADDDATGVLAVLLTGAGAATAAGSPRSGAVILGAIETLSRRVGYDPMQMDPVDGQAYVAATRAALSPGQYAAAHTEGAALDLPGACAVLIDLASAVPAVQAAGVAERLD
ncbi:transcriptional regulator, LuxR family [Blastococcus aggregatus]|uniref:Transcriptional regulator, LuxR family n=1 Tax=Blastococcus aggregatus TaxID=38502 RepID=A0A285V871_9ACTN|nr:adenylate/guanylate cyclase domain-containing protein [Blastococcus aggregatus]SOC50270.1 transcriptional regulator, LuxR family [Blastococcus aggregatus]